MRLRGPFTRTKGDAQSSETKREVCINLILLFVYDLWHSQPPSSTIGFLTSLKQSVVVKSLNHSNLLFNLSPRRVVLVENSISTNKLLASVQDATEALITPLSKGCRWNVDIPSLAREAGLEFIEGDDIQLGTIMFGIFKKPGE